MDDVGSGPILALRSASPNQVGATIEDPIKTILKSVSDVYGVALWPKTKVKISAPNTAFLGTFSVIGSGLCNQPDQAAHPVLIPFLTNVSYDSYGFSVDGSPQAGDTAQLDNTTSGNDILTGKINPAPSQLAFLSGVVAGPGVGVSHYGTFSYGGRAAPGSKDSVVKKPLLALLLGKGLFFADVGNNLAVGSGGAANPTATGLMDTTGLKYATVDLAKVGDSLAAGLDFKGDDHNGLQIQLDPQSGLVITNNLLKVDRRTNSALAFTANQIGVAYDGVSIKVNTAGKLYAAAISGTGDAASSLVPGTGIVFSDQTAPTTAPTALPATGTGVDPGDHDYVYTVLTPIGESEASPHVTATSSNTTRQINVGVPDIDMTAFPGATGVKLYRTKAGAPATYFYLTEVDAVTAISFNDTVADSALTSGTPPDSTKTAISANLHAVSGLTIAPHTGNVHQLDLSVVTPAHSGIEIDGPVGSGVAIALAYVAPGGVGSPSLHAGLTTSGGESGNELSFVPGIALDINDSNAVDVLVDPLMGIGVNSSNALYTMVDGSTVKIGTDGKLQAISIISNVLGGGSGVDSPIELPAWLKGTPPASTTIPLLLIGDRAFTGGVPQGTIWASNVNSTAGNYVEQGPPIVGPIHGSAIAGNAPRTVTFWFRDRGRTYGDIAQVLWFNPSYAGLPAAPPYMDGSYTENTMFRVKAGPDAVSAEPYSGSTGMSVTDGAVWYNIELRTGVILSDGGWHFIVVTYDDLGGTTPVGSFHCWVDGNDLGARSRYAAEELNSSTASGAQLNKDVLGATEGTCDIFDVHIIPSAVNPAYVAMHNTSDTPVVGTGFQGDIFNYEINDVSFARLDHFGDLYLGGVIHIGASSDGSGGVTIDPSNGSIGQDAPLDPPSPLNAGRVLYWDSVTKKYTMVPSGTTGQVLTNGSLGAPIWGDAPVGFVDPMTTAGDIIYMAPGATTSDPPFPTRLGVGSPADVLQIDAATNLPVWTTLAIGPVVLGLVVSPPIDSPPGTANSEITGHAHLVGVGMDIYADASDPTKITFSISGGIVTSVNGASDAVQFVPGPGIDITNDPAVDPNSFTITNSGVTHLNAEAGDLLIVQGPGITVTTTTGQVEVALDTTTTGFVNKIDVNDALHSLTGEILFTAGSNIVLSAAAGNAVHFDVPVIGYTGGSLEITGSASVDGDLTMNLVAAPFGAGAALTFTLASGVDLGIGNYEYVYTRVTASGETTASPTYTTTTTTGMQNVVVHFPDDFTGGVVSRKLYRTPVNTSGNYLLLATIGGAAAYDYTDTTSDGSLGTQHPPTSNSAIGSINLGNLSYTGDFQSTITGTQSVPTGYVAISVNGARRWIPYVANSFVAPSGGGGTGMANPMTTLGDIITGGADGSPQALGIGGSSQFLGVVGGEPSWRDLPSNVSSLRSSGGAALSGAVTISGTGAAVVTQVGQTITIDVTSSGGSGAPTGGTITAVGVSAPLDLSQYVWGAVTMPDGSQYIVQLYPAPAGSDIPSEFVPSEGLPSGSLPG